MNGPGVRDLGWQADAACLGLGDLFFGADGETWRECLRRVEQARAVCASCPVRQLCRDLAHVTRTRHGVWAGVDFERGPALPDGGPRLCRNGLHLMTLENSKPVGKGYTRCRECQRVSDKLHGPARHARQAERKAAA